MKKEIAVLENKFQQIQDSGPNVFSLNNSLSENSRLELTPNTFTGKTSRNKYHLHLEIIADCKGWTEFKKALIVRVKFVTPRTTVLFQLCYSIYI